MIRLSFYRRLFTAAIAATIAIDKVSSLQVQTIIDQKNETDENLLLPQAESQLDLAAENMSEL